MYLLIGIVFIVFAYTYAIKFLGLNNFYFQTNPDIGSFMYTLNKYTGADYVYDYALKHNYLKKNKESNNEFVVVDEYDTTIEYETDDDIMNII